MNLLEQEHLKELKVKIQNLEEAVTSLVADQNILTEGMDKLFPITILLLL